MAQVGIRVDFSQLPGDDDILLERLSGELAVDLSGLGTVEAVQIPAGPGHKASLDLVLTALTLVTQVDLSTVELLLETIQLFVRRNPGRTARLRVGEMELTVEDVTTEEVLRMIDIAQDMVRRQSAS